MRIIIKIKKQLSNFLLDVNISSKDKFVGLLGQSGSGKSMTLKCIAGIETPDSGEIIIDDVIFYSSEKNINLPCKDRKIGYLFQNYALFDNMTVFENISIALRDKNKNPMDFIQNFQLETLENKYPKHLSGGEQQRVAIARIFASEPNILLLDEPFSALDNTLKPKIEYEMLEYLKDFKGSIYLVSHNCDELYRICDEICIIDNGKLDYIDKKSNIFKNPKTLHCAELIQCENILNKIQFEAIFHMDINSSFISIPSSAISITNFETSFKFELVKIVECIDFYTIYMQKNNIILTKKVYNKLDIPSSFYIEIDHSKLKLLN